MRAISGRKAGLRVDRDSRPAEVLLEVVRGALLLPVEAAHVDEEALPPVVEKMPDDQLFVALRVERLAGGEDVLRRTRRAPAQRKRERDADAARQSHEDAQPRCLHRTSR